MRFALVSREVHPFIGGGLSRYVTATAETLAPLGEVTIFTTDTYEPRADEFEGSLEAHIKLVFVPEPDKRRARELLPLHASLERQCVRGAEAGVRHRGART